MKKLSFFLLSLMTIMFLSCGGSGENKKTIVYWSMWNSTEPQGQVIKEAIADFMKQNPDIKVDVTWNGREIRKTLQPALDNKQVIDMWDEDIERTIRTWGEYALKLDDLAAKSYDLTEGQAYQDFVMKSLLELAKTYSKDGGLYAIPYQPFLFTIMYNKEHFKKAGISEPPKTWDEFLATCEKLKAAGFTPMTTDDAYVDTIIGYHLARYKGQAWVKELVTKGLWDDPAVLRTAQDWENVYKKGYLSKNISGNKWPSGQQEIANGSVSMYLNGTWLVNEIMPSTGPDFPWGQFPYPTVAGGKGKLYEMNYGGQAFQINKDTKYPEETFKLLVFLTTGKWDKELAEKSYGVPVANTTDWPKQLADAKFIFANLGESYSWGGGIQQNPDKTPTIAANFTRLISGNLTATQFVAEVKK